jgi:hypothetical protein
MLRILQKNFALSLLDRAREPPAGIRAAGQASARRRFDIYRNNVFASLTDALATRFPVCRALVGDEFFRALAGVFVELSPPRSPVLMFYGDEFATFIDTFPPASSVPYLGDVARLEAGRTHAYHAADAEPLSVDELAAFAPCAWERMRVALHPSVQLVTSAYPIVSIWEAHLEPGRSSPVQVTPPEDALVARPNLAVEVRRLLPGGSVFLSRLAGHATLGEAFEGAAAAEPKFDLVANLTALLVSRIVVGLSMDC